jgi:hypothetical protein
MTRNPLGGTRERRESLTKQALAGAVRTRMAVRRLRQTDLARWSGVSRSFVQAVLRAQAASPLFMLSATANGPPRAASISRSRASYSTCHRHVLW